MELKDYIESATNASSVSTRIFTVILITTIISLSAFWNSRSIFGGNWMDQRIKTLNKMHFNDTTFETASKLKLKPTTLTKTEKDYIGIDGSNYVYNRNDSVMLADKLEHLHGLRFGSTYILKIDFLGVFIDLNDLAICAGVAFVFLYYGLFISLRREHTNLILVFDQAEKLDAGKGNEYLKQSYDLMVMAQVWYSAKSSKTPKEDFHKKGKQNRFMDALTFLPAICLLLILINDAWTYKIGFMIDTPDTWLGYLLGILLLGILVWLTYRCYKGGVDIDEVWDKALDKISPQNKL